LRSTNTKNSLSPSLTVKKLKLINCMSKGKKCKTNFKKKVIIWKKSKRKKY